MKFMLQHSIFIIYISCRGNHCDVPAGCVEGQFSQILWGNTNPELYGIFPGLIFTWEERAMCGSRLLLNSLNQRMKDRMIQEKNAVSPVLQGSFVGWRFKSEVPLKFY